MTTKSQFGFRPVPWRFSWIWFGGTFIIFFILNYWIVQFCTKRPLLGQDSNVESIKLIEATLTNQSHEVEMLRQEIERLRTASSSQEGTIQEMQRTLNSTGAKLAMLSGQLVKLRSSNDDVNRLVDGQEKSLSEIEKALADVKVQVEKIRDTMSQSSPKP